MLNLSFFRTIDPYGDPTPLRSSMSEKISITTPFEVGRSPASPFFEEHNTVPAAILVVDSEEINRRLLKAIFKTAPYRMLEARKASEAMALLQSEKVDLVILDLMLPEMSGPELCRWIRSNRPTRLVPVLMITNVQGVENEIISISSGADEFLIKPLHPAVVRTRVRAMLRNKALIDSLEEAETILFALAQTVEQRDVYTGQHCQRLAITSVLLGEALGLSEGVEIEPRYNITPSQSVSVIRAPQGLQPRHIEPLRWGLLPSWSTVAHGAKAPRCGSCIPRA